MIKSMDGRALHANEIAATLCCWQEKAVVVEAGTFVA